MNPIALLLFALAGGVAVAIALRRDSGAPVDVAGSFSPIGTVVDPGFAAPDVFEVFTAAVNNTLKKIFTPPAAAAPYLARPRAAHAPRFSDYEHLARVKEWSASGEEGEEA